MLRLIRALFIIAFLGSCSVVAFGQQYPGDDNATNSGAPCQLDPALSSNAHTSQGNGCVQTLQGNRYFVQEITSNPANCYVTSPTLNYGSGTNFTGSVDKDFNQRVLSVVVGATPGATTAPEWCSHALTTGALNGTGPGNAGGQLCWNANNHSEWQGGNFRNGNVGAGGCGNNASVPLTASNEWGDAGGRGTGILNAGAPLEIGNCVTAPDCANGFTQPMTALDLTSTNAQFFVPSSAFAEGNSAAYGDVILYCGQNAIVETTAMQVGMQGCLTIRVVRTATGQLVNNQYTVDTACSAPGTITAFNFTTTALANNACGGGWGFYQNEHGSIEASMDFTGETGAATITVKLPANGAFSAATCTFAAGGTPATDATGLAAAINGGTLSGTGCSTSASAYSAAVVPQCNTLFSCTVAANFVEVSCINCNPMSLGANNITGCLGCTANTVGYKDYRANNTGVNNMFSYGTRGLLYTWPDFRPYFYKLNDIQYQTSLGTPTAHANNLTSRFMVFLSHGPDVNCDGSAGTFGQWCWGNAQILKANTIPPGGTVLTSASFSSQPGLGGVPSANQMGWLGPLWVSPNTANTESTNYDDASGTPHTKVGLVKPCTAPCSPPANWVQPQLDMTYSGQNAIQEGSTTNPMFAASNESAALDNNTPVNDLFIGYPCWDSGSANKSALCYMEESGATGQTINAGFIDDTAPAGTNVLNQVYMVRAPSGTLYAIGVWQDVNAHSSSCATETPCMLLYKWNGSSWSFVSDKSPPFTTVNASLTQACTGFVRMDGTAVNFNCFGYNGTASQSWLPYNINMSQL